ncbi:MAG: RebB family R body protein [Pseudomonadota bacterium]
MNDAGTVNDQVVDSVNSITTLISAQSPAHAFAMLDSVMVETLGMAMYNAVNRQQNAGMVNSAAVTAACARMLNAQAPYTPPPPPPVPTPPVVNPLPGPTPAPSNEAVVKTAFSQGTAAIAALQAEATSTVAQEAQAGLKDLAQQAAATPTPTPTPPPSPVSATAAAPAPGSATAPASPPPSPSATAPDSADAPASTTAAVNPASAPTTPATPAAPVVASATASATAIALAVAPAPATPPDPAAPSQ